MGPLEDEIRKAAKEIAAMEASFLGSLAEHRAKRRAGRPNSKAWWKPTLKEHAPQSWPKLLEQWADFIEKECIPTNAVNSPRRNRLSVAAERTLISYLRHATGRPHFPEAAELLLLVFSIALPDEDRLPSFVWRDLRHRVNRTVIPEIPFTGTWNLAEAFLEQDLRRSPRKL